MKFRFIHAADLHLDSPFKGISAEHPTVAEILQNATFNAYEKLIQLCLEREVDALLVAGDVFDSADRSLKAQVQFIKGLKRLKDANIRAFICHGNHDPLDGWGAGVEMPSNVHQFGPSAEAVPLDSEVTSGPLVCGISYRTREMRKSLLSGFPSYDPERFTIGLLHANVGGSAEHDAYAPCSVDDLVAIGYDYWALGHVHTGDILREISPRVVYPGNTQGRHPNERGARGVYVVEVDERGDMSSEFVAVDAVRWDRLDVPIDGIEDANALFSHVDKEVERLLNEAAGCHLVYRVQLIGRGPMHQEMAQPGAIRELEEQLNSVGLDHRPFTLCGEVLDHTSSSLNRDALSRGQDFVGEFLALTKKVSGHESLFAKLRQELSPLYENPRFRRYSDDCRPLTKEDLPDVEDLALDLLVNDDEGNR